MHPYLSQRHMPYSGFNTIDLGLLSNATLFMSIILMVIGGGACSTLVCQSFDHDDVGVSCDESLSGEEGGQCLRKPFRGLDRSRHGEFDVVHGCRWTGADRVVDRRTIEYQQVPPAQSIAASPHDYTTNFAIFRRSGSYRRQC